MIIYEPFDLEDNEFVDDQAVFGEEHDWANGYGSDGEVDADALASAGFGTDEDYGGYGDYGDDW